MKIKFVFSTSFFCLFFIYVFSYAKKDQPIVLIDPAGHAGEVGRFFIDGYERAETLKFARLLQKKLIKRYNIKPIISRSPGEQVSLLQVASFSNRLRTRFFLKIHMYREDVEKPKLFFYHLVFNPLVDLAKRNFDRLFLIPIHQAHFGKIHLTRLWGKKMYDHLNQDCFKRYFDSYPLLGIPIKSLIGITAPAILLEIGICSENKWKSLVEPIVESLRFLGELC